MANPLRDPSSDWIARMRETPDLSRNTVLPESALREPPPPPRGKGGKGGKGGQGGKGGKGGNGGRGG